MTDRRNTAVRLAVALVLTFPALWLGAANAKNDKLIMGSGGVTGVYYPVAIAICRLYNADRAPSEPECVVESTGGSIQNLKRMRKGSLDLAIVQSDWQFHAYNGSSRFRDIGPDLELRSVLSLYPESFTVLARSNSDIKSISDLPGHRVNIGNPGSGQRATMEVVMRAFGWTRFSFTGVREFDSKHQAQALCDGEVEAIVFVAGHPSGTIKAATAKCSTNLVDVEGAPIKDLIAQHPYYRRAVIPAGMYFGQSREVTTFGVGATLVANAKVPNQAIKTLVRSVLENLGLFKLMHPALKGLKASEMKMDGLSAPLHDAAQAYFQTTARNKE